MTAGAGPSGLAVIDKPAGWTSHDVVAKCRGIFGTRKVGHSGTLDPSATGVLVLGVGRGTKLLRFLSGLPKTYEARITLGVETDSLDADGEVTVAHDMAAPTVDAVATAAGELTGDILQVPPMVSAIKVGGKRLHQLAREGKEVEREPRPVTVARFDVRSTGDPMVWDASVDCSSGTYVRVLAADLGHLLGGGAHLSGLRRTAVGPWGIDEAAPMESAPLAPTSQVSRVMESVEVDEATAALVRNGRVLARVDLGLRGSGGGPWAVSTADGELLAVYESHRGDTAKPAVVLAT
ncbi:MAG: tRNA pseudouridine(55) synthase TruB [Actinomycetia bacterium]|nr:tRNA pseudouridine(55) synthase TruB [Actinomycetes bacterium]